MVGLLIKGGGVMYWLSRYWNRVAYFLIRRGQGMVWDYTKKNGDLKDNNNIASDVAEELFCDRLYGEFFLDV